MGKDFWKMFDELNKWMESEDEEKRGIVKKVDESKKKKENISKIAKFRKVIEKDEQI